MIDCKAIDSDSWCCSVGGKSCDCSKSNITFPGAPSLVSTIPYPKSSATTSSEANLISVRDLSYSKLMLTSRNDSFAVVKRHCLLIFLLICLFVSLIRFFFGNSLFSIVGFSGANIDFDDLTRHTDCVSHVSTKIK